MRQDPSPSNAKYRTLIVALHRTLKTLENLIKTSTPTIENLKLSFNASPLPFSLLHKR